MHGRTDNVKTVYPPQTKFAGGGGIKTSKKGEKACYKFYADGSRDVHVHINY